MIHNITNTYLDMDSHECIRHLTHIVYDLYPAIVPNEQKSDLISRLMQGSHIGDNFNLNYYFKKADNCEKIYSHYIQYPEGRFRDFIEVGFYGNAFWVSVIKGEKND